MSLHPQVIALLEHFKSRNLPQVEEQDLQEARYVFEQSSKQLNRQEDIFKVEDRTISGFKDNISIRIYTPKNDCQLPALLYFHGGGWVIGNIESHDALCRSIANQAECIVVSVDYSLSPEQKFPVAIEDCYLALNWVYDHADSLAIDKRRLAVGGDSAGGNLATVVCHISNVRKGPTITGQVLFYPSTSFEETTSYRAYSEGYYLERSTMNWFTEQYLNDSTDALNPLASPMYLSDQDTSMLPKAFIATAEFDPLCDGGYNYASKLTKAGVETTYTCYKGMIHGFVTMTAFLEDGQRAITDASSFLKTVFA